ncbi:hypothetical protein AB1K84_23600 [Mesobacillus foraminis]|uniref:hypothetical protein n=1 Tax=Mesobacillus foraminis TaxID=279826 RepID=UPI0039A1474A
MKDLFKLVLMELKKLNASLDRLEGLQDSFETQVIYATYEIKSEQERTERNLYTHISENSEIIIDHLVDGIEALDKRMSSVEKAIGNLPKRLK